MADPAEMTTVHGTVLRIVQQTVRDVAMTQAVVKTDTDLITCMWRTAGMTQEVVEHSEYTFTGHLREINSRRVMIDPSFEPVTAQQAAKSAKATPGAKRKFGVKALKLSKKQLIIATVVLLIIIAVPVGFALFHKDKPVATTAKAPEKLPPAYDTTGKLITDTPNDCDLATVPFSSVNKNDPTLPLGQTAIKTAGVNGQDKLCYIHGRGQFPITNHIKQPVTQIVLVGTKK